MATNEILAFDAADTNTLTQSEYNSDAQRTGGMVAGVARSNLFNKAFKQSSIIAAGVAQFMADHQAVNVTDALTPAQISNYLADAVTDTIADTGNFARLNLAQSWTAAQYNDYSSLTSTSNSIAINLALSNSFSHTFTENTTLAAPSNVSDGQAGVIEFIQHASSAKTLSLNSFWKFTTSTPSISSTLSAVQKLFYIVDNGGASATCFLTDPRV